MSETTASRKGLAAPTPGPTLCWRCEHFKPQTFGIMPDWGICLKFEETSFRGGGCYWGEQKTTSGSRPRKTRALKRPKPHGEPEGGLFAGLPSPRSAVLAA